MISQKIRDLILEKYGKETIYSADCTPLAAEMGVGVTTVKRMFGLMNNEVELNREQRISTMDIVAQWLGYDSYRTLLREIGEGNFSSEFTSMESVEAAGLTEGTQIQLTYIPNRIIVMTYLGRSEFVVNESRNSKLLKGDRIKLTNMVLEQELVVTDVVRDGQSLGGYRAAKDGGLKSLEIIV